jgi:hypothetical protein
VHTAIITRNVRYSPLCHVAGSTEEKLMDSLIEA